MPARPTTPGKIALITALGVLPPALIFYVDAAWQAPPAPADAGAPASKADAGAHDAGEAAA